MIKYENGYAIFNGYKFRKDKKTGYYLSGVIEGKRYRLHRYVYETLVGEIPKGYDIHHKDQNKDNNEIENLELLTSTKHKQKHGHEVSDEMREFYRNNMNTMVRPKAIEWHKSKEGREWHKEQWKISLGNAEKIQAEMVCQYCGKTYIGNKTGNNKFCSNNCKSAYRRKLGIDNTIRVCEQCNKEFEINKYSQRKYCYECIPLKKRKK